MGIVVHYQIMFTDDYTAREAAEILDKENIAYIRAGDNLYFEIEAEAAEAADILEESGFHGIDVRYIS